MGFCLHLKSDESARTAYPRRTGVFQRMASVVRAKPLVERSNTALQNEPVRCASARFGLRCYVGCAILRRCGVAGGLRRWRLKQGSISHLSSAAARGCDHGRSISIRKRGRYEKRERIMSTRSGTRTHGIRRGIIRLAEGGPAMFASANESNHNGRGLGRPVRKPSDALRPDMVFCLACGRWRWAARG